MRTLNIDIETYSEVNLKNCGVYRYAEDPSFQILLFAFSVDGGGVQLIDLAQGETLPLEIRQALSDETVMKSAFNATFERICLSNYLGTHLSPKGWHCTMVHSATLGLPLSLKEVGNVIGIDKAKIETGTALIKFFCTPCTPTKVNGGRTRNFPHHDIEKWNAFREYNIRDVEAEMEISKRLRFNPMPKELLEEYWLDQEINDRGIRIDVDFVEKAVKMLERDKEYTREQMEERTGLANPNSQMQMKEWLNSKGQKAESLTAQAVSEMLEGASPEVAEVLKLWQKSSKSSVKKYSAMLNSVCKDGRLHGMFQFYGANRTGRWAGRLVQLQNLPQNHMKELQEVRTLVKNEDFDGLNILYDNLPQVFSELVRTAFIPKEGSKFIVADFSSIEARVLSALAKEDWKLEVFKNNGDIYCETASRMFHVNVEKNGENAELRQKGKQAELGCGYGGSVGALISMGALSSGMQQDELKPLVNSWREANPNIVKLWYSVEEATAKVTHSEKPDTVNSIEFSFYRGYLVVTLPSGRKLHYADPEIGTSSKGIESVMYKGLKGSKWQTIESYGAKFVENITQAIARDLLMYSLQNLRNFQIVAHVHDEVIIEDNNEITLEEVCEIMSRSPEWGQEIPLNAEGYTCEFYKKE